MLSRRIAFTVLMFAVVAGAAAQGAPGAPQVRLRGTLEKVEPGFITVLERRGERITLALPDNLPITEALPSSLAEIRPGSYIGTAAITRADGALEALEVQVFPETSRGVGEGHRPWDLQPDSTMTNATVAELASVPEGRRLVLKYKDGEKLLYVPEKAPIVTFKPGDRSLIVPGAKVMITAAERDGKPVVLRLTAGRNGYTPPM